MCNGCIHNKVCVHQFKLFTALESILEITYGGQPKGWREFGAVVEKNCKYRTAEPPTQEGSNKQPTTYVIKK